MKVTERYLIKLTLVSLILLSINTASAQSISQVGNGRLYYCSYEDTGDGMFAGFLHSAKNDNYVRFSVALSRTYQRIASIRNKISNVRNLGTTKPRTLRTRLANLRQTRTDLINCRRHGTTGRDPNSISNPNNACSVVGHKSGIASEIINGDQCTIGNSGIIFISIRDSEGFAGACTGTVVRTPSQNAGRAVIFAAHCIENSRSISINTPAGKMSPSFYAAYPGWDPVSNYLEDGDVAIAVFDTDIPTQAYRILGTRNVAIGETAVIAGYGENENGNSSANRLRAGYITISESTSFSLANNYNGSQSNTCYGDSGGPLLVQRDSEWQLAGVTSNGILDSCGIGDTSYYALLSKNDVKNWINSIAPGLVN